MALLLYTWMRVALLVRRYAVMVKPPLVALVLTVIIGKLKIEPMSLMCSMAKRFLHSIA